MKNVDNNPGAVFMGGTVSGMIAARNLAEHGVKVCVLGSAPSETRFSNSVTSYVTSPRPLSFDDIPGYLVRMAEKHRLRGWVLFSISDEHLRIVSQHHAELSQYYTLTVPPWETLQHLYDKRLTRALAVRASVPVPREYSPDSEDIDFPVVLKPSVSYPFCETTGIKAYRVENRQQLRDRYGMMSEMIGPEHVIVQEYIPGHSTSLFSCAGWFYNGRPIATLAAKRTRQCPREFGKFSTFVETVEIPEIRQLATALLAAIDYTGLAEVEFMWNQKTERYELLEVNARFWAWYDLAIEAGLDLPYTAYCGILNRNTPRRIAKRGRKWVRLPADLRVAAGDILTGKMRLGKYLASLRGAKWYAFSGSDLVPLLAWPFLSLLKRFKNLANKRILPLLRRPGVH